MHLTYEFWSFAKEYKIILIYLSSHFTHLIQPLDVGCFQPFKHYHTQVIDCVVQLDNVEFGKLQFLAEFQNIRSKTFTEATIYSAWKKTSLISFNPEMMLSKIREYQNIQSTVCFTTPPSTSISNTILDCIPHSAKEIVEQRVVL